MWLRAERTPIRRRFTKMMGGREADANFGGRKCSEMEECCVRWLLSTELRKTCEERSSEARRVAWLVRHFGACLPTECGGHSWCLMDTGTGFVAYDKWRDGFHLGGRLYTIGGRCWSRARAGARLRTCECSDRSASEISDTVAEVLFEALTGRVSVRSVLENRDSPMSSRARTLRRGVVARPHRPHVKTCHEPLQFKFA